MSITLYQFKPMGGLPNPSPFCMKLETYLRMSGLPHTVETMTSMKKSPTGKAPVVEIDGVVMADSGVIINHLERTHGHPVDGKLTLAQRAESLAFQRMIEEHLYWVALYARWIDPDHTAERRPVIGEIIGMPAWMMSFMGGFIERGMMKRMKAHGLGLHGAEGIWQMGIADIQALSQWLGNRTWGFNDTPTTFDACLASMIALITRTGWENPLTRATQKHPNLVAHAERMMARYFPEFTA
jgi:glutathione S-transferase